MAKHQHYPRDGLKHVCHRKKSFGWEIWKGCAGVGQGRAGQAGRVPVAGKKGHLQALYLCVFDLLSACLLVFPPQDRLQPLACKQSEIRTPPPKCLDFSEM